MRILLKSYFDVLDRRPLLVKIASGVVIFSASDLLAQTYEHFKPETTGYRGDFEWDSQRTVRMAIFGGIINIEIHFWWGFLESRLERIISSKTSRFKNAAVKVLIDQAIGAPFFNVVFFASQSLLQGHTCSEAADAVTDRLPTQLARHYQFWPYANFITFSLFSLHKRVIVRNILTVGWGAYLSRCEKEFDQKAVGVRCKAANCINDHPPAV